MLARDLHDGILQSLTAARLQLRAAAAPGAAEAAGDHRGGQRAVALSDVDQARRATLRVLADFLESGTATPGTLGHVETTDDRNQCVAQVHFPQR